MGFWDVVRFNDKRYVDRLTTPEPVQDVKEYSYSENQGRSGYTPFLMSEHPVVWTESKTYSERAISALQNGVSRACILQRAIAISNIDLEVEGSSKAKLLMTAPNVKDGDIQTFLKNGETVLSIGGKLPLFWDNRLPSRPQVHAFRPDLVRNDIENSKYLYNPRALNGQFTEDSADFVFKYDPITGKTIQAWQREGRTLREINGGLQYVTYYDPRNSSEGLSPISPVMRHIDLLQSIETLFAKKFNSGGTMAGFYQIPPGLTDDDVEQIRAQFAALNPSGSGNALPAGVEYNSAQMTFAEMSVLEVRAQLISEICTALQVPAEMINQATSTYANVRGKDKIFYRNFIGPEAHWLVGQLQAGLRMYVDEKAKVTVDETSVQHLEEDRLEKSSKMSQMKAFKVNEIRAVLGYEEIAGEEGEAIVGADVNMGQPEEKPKGDVTFNANAGNRGDDNDN